MDAPEPVPFGDYLLYDRIGVGGMAEIFLASSRGIGSFEKRLVIKRILPSLSTDDQFVRMFVEEAKLCATLRHPNIVQVYDLGEINQQFFIAMEFVDGKDLLKTLSACGDRRIGFPTDLALFIVIETLKGLQYAHRVTDADGGPLGIIHRDVSPSNVFLSYEGQVKIGDFGIAKASSREKTATGILKGKFGYMAPEQVIGRGIDHRADIFASGILLYELLSGHRLFVGPNDLAVLQKVRDAVVEPPLENHRPDLDPALLRVVRTALSKDPIDRYQSAEAMRTALETQANVHGISAGSSELARFLQRLFLPNPKEQARRARFRLPLIRVEDSDTDDFSDFGPVSTADSLASNSSTVDPPEFWQKGGASTEVTSSEQAVVVSLDVPVAQRLASVRERLSHSGAFDAAEEPTAFARPHAAPSWDDPDARTDSLLDASGLGTARNADVVDPGPSDSTGQTPSDDLEDRTLMGGVPAALADAVPLGSVAGSVTHTGTDPSDDELFEGSDGFGVGAEQTVPFSPELLASDPNETLRPSSRTLDPSKSPFFVSEPLLSEIPMEVDEAGTTSPGVPAPAPVEGHSEMPLPEFLEANEEDPDSMATQARGTVSGRNEPAAVSALGRPVEAEESNDGEEDEDEGTLNTLEPDGQTVRLNAAPPRRGGDTKPMFADSELSGPPAPRKRLRVKERVRQSAVRSPDMVRPQPESDPLEPAVTRVSQSTGVPSLGWIIAGVGFGAAAAIVTLGIWAGWMPPKGTGRLVIRCASERTVEVQGVGRFDEVRSRSIQVPTGLHTIRFFEDGTELAVTAVSVRGNETEEVPCP